MGDHQCHCCSWGWLNNPNPLPVLHPPFQPIPCTWVNTVLNGAPLLHLGRAVPVHHSVRYWLYPAGLRPECSKQNCPQYRSLEFWVKNYSIIIEPPRPCRAFNCIPTHILCRHISVPGRMVRGGNGPAG